MNRYLIEWIKEDVPWEVFLIEVKDSGELYLRIDKLWEKSSCVKGKDKFVIKTIEKIVTTDTFIYKGDYKDDENVTCPNCEETLVNEDRFRICPTCGYREEDHG